MRKGVISIGVILLVLSLILFTFAIIGDHEKVKDERFELGSEERNGIQGTLMKGDELVIVFTSNRPVTVYIADVKKSVAFADAVFIFAEQVTFGKYTWEAMEDGEFAVMFKNDGLQDLTVDVEIEYRRVLIEVFWMVGTIIMAIGMAVMIAGGIMHSDELEQQRSELSSTYREKGPGKRVTASGSKGRKGRAVPTKAEKRKNGTGKARKPRPVETEKALDPRSRMPMYGSYSFGTKGEEEEGSSDEWSTDDVNGKDEDVEAQETETKQDRGDIVTETSRPSWDDGSDDDDPVHDTAAHPGGWASKGWDDFGDGTASEESTKEEPEEDEDEDEDEERPSEWLRKMLDSS